MTLSGMGGPGSPGSVLALSLVTLTQYWPLIGWWAAPRPPRPQMALITAYFDNSLSPIMFYWLLTLSPIFLVPQSCQWMPCWLSIMTVSTPASWHLTAPDPLSLIAWPGSPLGPNWPCPLPLDAFPPTSELYYRLPFGPQCLPGQFSASDWSVSLHTCLWLAERPSSQEGCVSESHKLVFKALYLLIKPTSEEFVTRTPALFVSLPKRSTRARPNWDLLTKLFSSLAFVMFEAFWGRSG